MRRDTQHVILGLLGGALIKLAVAGGYLAYVRPAHQPWLLAAGVVMVVLAVVGLVRDMRAVRVPATDPVGVVDHEHEGGGHAPWLMVLPVLAILLVPPAALGADAVHRTAGNSGGSGVAAATPRFAPLPPGDAPALSMSDFVARAISERSGSLDGRTVTLTGFVVRRDSDLLLARLVISCCAADARAMTVHLVGSGLDYPPDTWLQVRGQLQPGTATPETRYVPALTVSDVAVVPAPEDPYEL